jgi:uncharacterized protein DUF547
MITAILVLVCSAAAAEAAPPAELWAKWQAHDDASTASIDHAAWDRFLRTYVRVGQDRISRIPYSRVSKSDRDALSADLSRLAAIPISSYSRRRQFAFWVDLYNELTVKLVLDHYPVSSIRDIRLSPGLFAVGPWGKKLITVEGEPLSLDDIEHRILRPIWRIPGSITRSIAPLSAVRICSRRHLLRLTAKPCSTRRRANTSTTRGAPLLTEDGSRSRQFMCGIRSISAGPKLRSSSI